MKRKKHLMYDFRNFTDNITLCFRKKNERMMKIEILFYILSMKEKQITYWSSLFLYETNKRN